MTDEPGAPGGLTSLKVGDLDAIGAEARRRIGAAVDEAALDQVRVELLGKKGALTGALRGLGSLPADQRAAAGARANALKAEIEDLVASRARELQAARLQTLGDQEWVDMTFVPSPVRRGHLHPLTLILREVKAIFSSVGYEVALVPQAEDEYHNFEALNFAHKLPARNTRASVNVE